MVSQSLELPYRKQISEIGVKVELFYCNKIRYLFFCWCGEPVPFCDIEPHFMEKQGTKCAGGSTKAEYRTMTRYM